MVINHVSKSWDDPTPYTAGNEKTYATGEKENHRLKSADWHGERWGYVSLQEGKKHHLQVRFFKMVLSLENKQLEPENGCLDYDCFLLAKVVF